MIISFAQNVRIFLKKHLNYSLLFTLSLAIILRFLPAYFRSIWDDEAFIYFASGKSIPEILNPMIDPTHPPFMLLLVHFLRLIIDRNAFLLRTPSLIAGILVVLLMYSFGKEYKSKRFALILSLIFSITPFFTTFSWQLRNYVFAHLTVSAILLLLFSGSNNYKKYALYLVIIIAPWINYGLIYLLLALIVWFLVRIIFQYKEIFPENTVFLSSAIGIELIFLYLMNGYISSNGAYFNKIQWIPEFNTQTFMATIFNMYGYFDFIGKYSDLFSYEKVLMFILITVSIYGAARELCSEKKNNRQFGILLLLMVIVPIITSVFISETFVNIFLWRNLFVTAAALSIGLALSIERVYAKNAKIGILFIFVLIAICILNQRYFIETPRNEFWWEKTNWRYIAEQIKQDNDVGHSKIWFVDEFYLRNPFDFYWNNESDLVVNYSCSDKIQSWEIKFVNWIILPKKPIGKSNCLKNIIRSLKCDKIIKINENLYKCTSAMQEPISDY